jgi:beta-N-acetylhexosaminidase
LGLLALVAFVGGLLIARGGDESEPATSQSGAAATPPPEAPACPVEIASSARRLAGQMLMVRMEATATEGLRERIAAGELGGVIVFPPDGTDPAVVGREVARLRAAAERAGAPQPLVATDQEGGDVERFPDLPPELSAPEMGAAGEADTQAEGRATGTALRELGIDVDLAPVLDVPEVDGAFMVSRAFADDPARVAALGVAFGIGLQAADVAATAKHFPGLGLAVQNTDEGPSVVEASRGDLEGGLQPFEAAIDADFGLVMVSNATYPALDGEPASQSRRVIDELLREQLGFAGVVITDDLGAGGLTGAGLDEAAATVGAADAGADVLLTALTEGEAAHAALVAAIRSGDLDRERLLASCARTMALRERLAS